MGSEMCIRDSILRVLDANLAHVVVHAGSSVRTDLLQMAWSSIHSIPMSAALDNHGLSCSVRCSQAFLHVSVVRNPLRALAAPDLKFRTVGRYDQPLKGSNSNCTGAGLELYAAPPVAGGGAGGGTVSTPSQSHVLGILFDEEEAMVL